MDDDLKLVIAIARTYHTFFAHIQSDIDSFGLSASEFGVLELLWHKGPQAIQQIGAKILVTSGTMTYVIDKLEKRGLVARRKCTTDGRVIYADLTEAGRALISEIFPKHHDFIKAYLSAFPSEEKKAILGQLKNFHTYLLEVQNEQHIKNHLYGRNQE